MTLPEILDRILPRDSAFAIRLRAAELLAAAGAFVLGSTLGVLGAFVAGLAFAWFWFEVERWAEGVGG